MTMYLRCALARSAAALCAALLVPSANASFHLYQINEIYSDASGNVQFIELTTTAMNQQFLNGISLSTSQGSTTHNFTFPSSFASDSANTKILIATQGFANLGVVTPDYIVPNGFFFLPGGSINYGGADILTYPPLPTDGTNSINRLGATALNSPTNFAGQTGSVNVAPPVQAGPLDVDGNGEVTALTDGLMVIRYLFGLRGASLISNALGPSAVRNTATLIESYLSGILP